MGGASMFSRLLSRFTPVVLCTVLGTLLAVPAGAAGVGTLGGFEIDGNQVAGDATVTGIDWASVTPTMATDDTADSGFQGSSKELQPSAWICNTGGNNPGKGNILRAYVNPRVSAAGKFLDLAWVREDISGVGDVHLNFEFNQQPSTAGSPTSGPCGITRVAGDLLVTYDFSGGTATPTVSAYLWDPTGGNGADEGEWDSLGLSSSSFNAAVNTGSITDVVNGGTSVGDRRFGEATVNLQAALNSSSGCRTFGYVNVRSRSSESISGGLQDRLATTPVELSTCGSLKVVKHDGAGQPLPGATFEVWRDNGNGVFDAAAPDILVATQQSGSDGSFTLTSVEPGNYFVREIAAPPGYVWNGSAVAVTVDAGEDEVVPTFVNNRIQYSVSVTPDGTHLVGDPHDFTVVLLADAAPVANATVDLDWSGAVGSAPTTCTTDSNGECLVEVVSSTPGSGSLGAGYVSPFGIEQAPAPATATWVDYDITVTPKTAVNPVNTNHEFTVLLEIDSGDGFEVAADEDIALVLDGVGIITEIDSGSVTPGTSKQAGTCTTNDEGECYVTITSPVVGLSELTGTFTTTISGVTGSWDDSGLKQWITADVPTTTTTEPPTTTPTTQSPGGDTSGTSTTNNPPATDPAPVDPAPGPVAPDTGAVSFVTQPAVQPEQPALALSPAGELPRTGAGGLQSQTLLALSLLLAGLTARAFGRRRQSAQG